MYRLFYGFVFSFLVGSNLLAQGAKDLNLLYQKPAFFDFVKYTYDNQKNFFSTAFSKEQMPIWLGVLGATAVTYYYDRPIYESARDFGNSLGLDENSQMQKAFCFHPKACLQVPSDGATSLYFLGDGLTYIAMASSFLGYGHLNDDNRAISTGSQIFEGLVNVTILTQALKRMTGRQTPMRANDSDSDRGEWHLLPSVSRYQSDIPNYDAYPSGHTAATTVAFTILLENYPEYGVWIKSSYGVVVSALMFGMLHQGVHWASDYPLAMAIGYYVGKGVARRNRPSEFYEGVAFEDNSFWGNAQVIPMMGQNHYGLSLVYHY